MFNAELEGGVDRSAVDAYHGKSERERLGLDTVYARLVYLLNEATDGRLGEKGRARVVNGVDRGVEVLDLGPVLSPPFYLPVSGRPPASLLIVDFFDNTGGNGQRNSTA